MTRRDQDIARETKMLAILLIVVLAVLAAFLLGFTESAWGADPFIYGQGTTVDHGLAWHTFDIRTDQSFEIQTLQAFTQPELWFSYISLVYANACITKTPRVGQPYGDCKIPLVNRTDIFRLRACRAVENDTGYETVCGPWTVEDDVIECCPLAGGDLDCIVRFSPGPGPIYPVCRTGQVRS